MMYRDPDAAADLGAPSRRPARSRPRLRVHRLERRRATPPPRRSSSSARRSARPASPASIPRTSTTSRRPGRRSSSSTAAPVRSSGPRSRSTPPACPRAPRDLVLLQGAEPSMRWRSFSRLVVDLAEALGTQLVVTLGALLADVPHSRPVPITGLSSDEVAHRPSRAAADVRTRARPASSACCTRPARRPACRPRSLWASVPHYVAAAPNPKAALALVRKLESLVGVSVDAEELERSASDYERQVSARRPERPRRPGLRRAPGARRRRGGGRDARPGPPVRRRPRARVPALPAPARARADRLAPGANFARGSYPRYAWNSDPC